MNRIEKHFKINRVFRTGSDDDAPLMNVSLWEGIVLGILTFVGVVVLASMVFGPDHMVSDINKPAVLVVSGADPGGDSAEAVSAAHLFADQFFLTPRDALVQTYPEFGE